MEPHQKIYNCFKDYEGCLHRNGYRIPGGKAMIYAYCNALDIETQPSRRDYCDAKHWNLDNATALQPLKQFLQSLML